MCLFCRNVRRLPTDPVIGRFGIIISGMMAKQAEFCVAAGARATNDVICESLAVNFDAWYAIGSRRRLRKVYGVAGERGQAGFYMGAWRLG
jgi:hypothetical protein